MKLHEYEAKKIFLDEKIPVPKGKLAFKPEEVKDFAEELGKPVIVKSQVLVAGRGKAGGIRGADSPGEALEVARQLLSSRLKGFRVEKLLVEEKVDIERELYLSLIIDRSGRKHVFLASGEGGVDIEELAAKSPEKIFRLHVNPFLGVRDFEARKLVKAIGMRGYMSQLVHVIKSFYRVSLKYDCELVESNPLALTTDGRIVAVDARMIIDDNSLFRQLKFKRRIEEERGELTELEAQAIKEGFSYVDLEGSIGVIANGAGLTMASMDLVAFYGGKPANFLDIGGGASSERVKKAVELQLINPRVVGVLINIMAGITRCDEVARGLIEAMKETGIEKPTVIRMVGTREKEGRKILEEAGISYLETMEEAAEKIVKLVGGM